MARLALLAVAALLGGALPAFANDATAVSSGVCAPESPEPQLDAIGDAVARASAHPDPQSALREHVTVQENAIIAAQARRDAPPCIPADDGRRAANEEAELSKIEESVKKAADDQCKESICVSNFTHFVTGYNTNPWTFGNCDNWSRLAVDTIGKTSYFDTRREQRCTLYIRCHWVVVLENARTGDVHVIDLWAYKGGWAPGATKSWYVSADYDAFKKKFGEVADTDTYQKKRCP